MCEERFAVAVFCIRFMPVDRQVGAAAVAGPARMVAGGRCRRRAPIWRRCGLRLRRRGSIRLKPHRGAGSCGGVGRRGSPLKSEFRNCGWLSTLRSAPGGPSLKHERTLVALVHQTSRL